MTRKGSKPTKADKSSDATPARVGVAFRLPPALVERLARTAFHLGGPPEVLRQVDVIERGIEYELARLERKYNGGRPYPPIPNGLRLRGGRRSGR